MFTDFFKRRKMRVARYGELVANRTVFSVVFFENDNGRRRYTVSSAYTYRFKRTIQFIQCETWKHTGLFPEWAKDPLAEKLSR